MSIKEKNMGGNKKKIRDKKSIWEIGETLFGGLLGLISALCVLLVLVVMPFYNREGFTHIGSDKSYFFRTASGKMGTLLLPVIAVWGIFHVVTLIVRKEKPSRWKDLFSVQDCFVLAYGTSCVISYFCSNYKETASWGTSGWYMGTIPQLTLVSIYFLVSRFLNRKWAEWILYSGLAASAGTFLLGCLNRFDIWPLPMENSGRPLFISTVGNINWYCCYVVTMVFVGVGLLWLDQGRRRLRSAALCVYVFLGFCALITQGSESGIFSMAVVLLILFLLSVFWERDQSLRRFWLILELLAGAGLFIWILCLAWPGRMNYTSGLGKLFYGPFSLLLLAVAIGGSFLPARGCRMLGKGLCILVPVTAAGFVTLIVLNTLNPGSIGALSTRKLFLFDDSWGSHRGATWTLGLRCFSEQNPLHMLVGIGPDCMAEYLYKGASPELTEAARAAFPGKRLTNAHCELLTILVNQGLLGMITYGGIFVSLFVGFLKNRCGGLQRSLVSLACGIGVFAYIFNNLWSFQQSLGAALVFVLLGLAALK